MLVKNLKFCLVYETDTIRKCILNLEKSTQQIIFVVNKQKKLLGSITDGDIRRAILNKFSINETIKPIYNNKPIKCLEGTTYTQAENIMIVNKINHLPIVNNKSLIVGFYKLSLKIIMIQKINVILLLWQAVKERLRPYTLKVPKPMLKINDEPILKLIIKEQKNLVLIIFIFQSIILEIL